MILGQAVPPTSLYGRLYVLQVLGADALPLLVASQLRPEHHPLLHVAFSIAIPTGKPRLSEVHNVEDVFVILAGVADSEMEPLLVTSRVCVDLDVHLVVGGVNSVGLEQITRLKQAVHEEHVAIVVTVQLHFVHFVVCEVLV